MAQLEQRYCRDCYAKTDNITQCDGCHEILLLNYSIKNGSNIPSLKSEVREMAKVLATAKKKQATRKEANSKVKAAEKATTKPTVKAAKAPAAPKAEKPKAAKAAKPTAEKKQPAPKAEKPKKAAEKVVEKKMSISDKVRNMLTSNPGKTKETLLAMAMADIGLDKTQAVRRVTYHVDELKYELKAE
jgi:phage protein D